MYQYCLLTQVFQKSLMVRYLVQFHNINHTSKPAIKVGNLDATYGRPHNFMCTAILDGITSGQTMRNGNPMYAICYEMILKTKFSLKNLMKFSLTVESRLRAVFHFTHTIVKCRIFHCFVNTQSGRTNALRLDQTLLLT